MADEEKEYTFNYAMSCDGCKGQAERVLAKLGDGKVKVLEANVAEGWIKVRSSSSKDEVLAALEKTGKKCSFKE